MEFKRVEKDNVLLIDDVTSNLITLSEIIRNEGYIARPVKSVEYAMKAVDAELPSIILLDVTMPDMNGYDYCRILKKDIRTRNIPVIFISGLTGAKDRIRGFECGAVDFITKPFENMEVLMRINTHLKEYHMQKNLYIRNQKLNILVSKQLQQLETERINLITCLAKLCEDRDIPESYHHSDNIAANSKLIAMGLSLTPKYEKVITNNFIDMIEIAARLHDVGKLAVPEKVILKKGRLGSKEADIMYGHCEEGRKIVESLSDNGSGINIFLRMAMDIVKYHHKRWDEGGHTRKEFPLPARIVGICDVFDSLTAPRIYKKPYSKKAALKAIKAQSGRMFDPDLVDIMLRLERRLVVTEHGMEVDDDDEYIPEWQITDLRR
ncbi:MAG: response regulator [Lachnospiraceae bacterium]|nr:response regulator [Lachnospiraceae bacterium]MBQ6090131.1 response regulator [Lachnospiraceae bacterium]MBR5368197.1 response regulator [Lachnospiraceae bacterium]